MDSSLEGICYFSYFLILAVCIIFLLYFLKVKLIDAPRWQEEERKRKENFIASVLSLVHRLLDDSELLEMGNNFISKLPTKFFMNRDLIVRAENGLIIRDIIGKSMLLSTDEDRKSTYIGSTSYLDNDLSLFSNFILERHGITDPVLALYSTYLYVYRLSIRYFAQKWVSDFQEYFSNETELSLEKAIKLYCSIETINIKDDQNIGMFIYYLIDRKVFPDNNENYLRCKEIFAKEFEKIQSSKNYENYIENLRTSEQQKLKHNYTLDDIDLMNGQEFEQFVALLFSRLGFQTEVTKASGDQGIDVIVSKKGRRIGVQAKCYSGKVSNKAIQEAVAGIKYYNLSTAIVVTNNFFTNSAYALADANSVILWDRNILREKITEAFSPNPKID